MRPRRQANSKTFTDLIFEKYLRQEKLGFQFEPYRQKGTAAKNPDYLVKKDGQKILVECKEMEEGPWDNLRQGVGTLDIGQYYDVLRDRIKAAAKQLKPYRDQVVSCVVLFGKARGCGIDIDELFHAMFGNPIFSVPISTKSGGPAGKVSLELTASGALRKSYPDKSMWVVHDYISAVGVVESFSAATYYQRQIMDPIMKSYAAANRHKPLEEQAVDFLDHYRKVWRNKRVDVPKEFRSPRKLLYRVRLISNPLGRTPLREGVFAGRWDTLRLPAVSEK